MQGLNEERLSCSICSDLFNDPRTLPCGHSFCAHCLQQWRRNHNSCPFCRADIGDSNPSRNTTLADIVDHFREQRRSRDARSEDDESTVHSQSRPRETSAPVRTNPARERDAETMLRARLLQLRAQSLTQRLQRLEAGMGELMEQQDAWSEIQEKLNAAQAKVGAALNSLNRRVQERVETVHAAGSTLAELNATAASENAHVAALNRGIEAANRLANRLDSVETSNADARQERALEETQDLVRRLTSCLARVETDSYSASGAEASASREEPVERLLAAELEAHFSGFAPDSSTTSARQSQPSRQRQLNETMALSQLAVCTNTSGYLCVRGRIVKSGATATVAAAVVNFALPEKVVILIESDPQTETKIKVYGETGGFKGRIELRLPSGGSLTTSRLDSLAVNNAQQLLAVGLPNSVLVTLLDGTGKQLVSSCSGRPLGSPLGVCFSDEARLFISDHRSNQRVCCVNCNSGDTLAVFETGRAAELWEEPSLNSSQREFMLREMQAANTHCSLS